MIIVETSVDIKIYCRVSILALEIAGVMAVVFVETRDHASLQRNSGAFNS